MQLIKNEAVKIRSVLIDQRVETGFRNIPAGYYAGLICSL
jgi:hypothetical protein